MFVLSRNQQAAVPFLEPYDGQAAHEEDAAAFPADDVVFWPFKRDQGSISTDEILLLRSDIERYASDYLPSVDIGMPVPDFLNKSHPCYSEKLAKAVECWTNLFGKDGSARHNVGYGDQIRKWRSTKAPAFPQALDSIVQPKAKGGAKQADLMNAWKKDIADIKK